MRIEGRRRIRELGGADVDDPVLVFDLRILRGDLVKDFVKEAISDLHDVVFREAGDLLAIVAARIFKSVAHDLFRAGPRDELEALRHLIGLLILDAAVHIFFIFAHDDDIHAGMFGFDERDDKKRRDERWRKDPASCGR